MFHPNRFNLRGCSVAATTAVLVIDLQGAMVHASGYIHRDRRGFHLEPQWLVATLSTKSRTIEHRIGGFCSARTGLWSPTGLNN